MRYFVAFIATLIVSVVFTLIIALIASGIGISLGEPWNTVAGLVIFVAIFGVGMTMLEDSFDFQERKRGEQKT